MLDLITLISAVGLQQELKEAPKEAIIKEDTAGWAIGVACCSLRAPSRPLALELPPERESC